MKKPPASTYYSANSSKEWWENQKRWEEWERFERRNKKASDYMFKFGKYKGKTIEQVFKMDRGYLNWAFRTLDKSEASRMITKFYNEHNQLTLL